MSGKQGLVLIPGLYCDDALWEAQSAGLADRAEVRIADVTKDSSIAAMAERILASAPERFAVAGLSMGGYVALELWRQAPERVTRIALLDTNARSDSAKTAAARRGFIARARETSFEPIVRGALPVLMRPDTAPDIVERFVAMALRVGLEGYARQQEAIITRADSRADLPTITVPTLVLVGEEDRLTPPELSEEIAAAVPGAVLERIARCGHLSTMEQPEAVTAALKRWLEVTPAA